MTKTDIIMAAFKVWGRDLYKNTSLSQISNELGVSKPALYRHFKDKEALLDEMYEYFFNNFSIYVRESYEKAIKMEKWEDCFLTIMKTFSKYYLSNKYLFAFSLVQVYSRRDREKVIEEFAIRGLDLTILSGEKYGEEEFFPSKFHITMVTLIYNIAQFHQNSGIEQLSDEEAEKITEDIVLQITRGLGLDAEKIKALDYTRLEKQASLKVDENRGENQLLEAVAAAVAEAGPWNVSMEMVARLSGLSKSGLYAHFQNKEDMLNQLFMTEFSNLVGFAKAKIETTLAPEEQLYLGIVSIASYLRSRPQFLLSLEWLKTRQPDLKNAALEKLGSFIRSIKLELVKQQDPRFLLSIAQLVLFMIVSIMVWWPIVQKERKPEISGEPRKGKLSRVPRESFRIIFRFIALGFTGLNMEGDK